MLTKTLDMSNFLDSIIDPELKDLLLSIEDNSGYFELPSEQVSLSMPIEVSRTVALVSNKYAKASRLAGVIRARYKIAEANYKYKFRTNLGHGKNAAQREAQAMEAASAEYEEMIYLESALELAESVETSCRVASESARRMLLGSQQTMMADHRYDQNSGALKDSDFSVY